MPLKHPNPLMLVRIAQGDAFGMACEYIKFPRDREVYDRALRFESYGKHPTHKLERGQYTDDTQMSIAVSEALISDKGLLASLLSDEIQHSGYVKAAQALRHVFAEGFVRCFKRDPRDGYSRNFQEFLEGVVDAADFLKRINPESDKNGAAMRAVPLGVLPTPALVGIVAHEQAAITHDTDGGRASAGIVALMSHFALYTDEPFSRVRDWLSSTLPLHPLNPELLPWQGGPVQGPGVGINTARAVMTLLMSEKSLIGIARKTIEWGGDTDSVLAIAWGIASTRMRDELPPFFDGGLENGTYGRTFLQGLGSKLMETYS